jgi:transposase
MDNASIHKSELIKDILFDKTNIVFNTPYSPHLNPIELVFSKWKKLVKN